MSDENQLDPAAWLRLSDRDLGLLLLAQFAAAQAQELGLAVEQMPEAFMETVRQHVLTLQAESAKLAPVEVALHAVASGDPDRAGRLYRQLLMDGATALVYERFTAQELHRRAVGRRKGGKYAGQARSARSRRSAILAAAAALEKAGKPRGSWRGIIAKRLSLSPQYVGRVLSKEQ